MARFASAGCAKNSCAAARMPPVSDASMSWPTTWKKPHSRQARSIARRDAAASRSAMSMTGTLSITMVSFRGSRSLARVHPLRQQAVGVELDAAVECDAGRFEARLQRAVTHRVEQIGAAADVHAADIDLRDRRRAGALLQHGAHADAELVLLE